jgi:tetratricopeptide (TPR) repeat protein
VPVFQVAVVLVVVLGAGGVARADDGGRAAARGGAGGVARADDAARAAAREHYARGLELARDGGYQAALAEFDAAYAISPQFAVLYNIAQCHVALGHLREAIDALSKYLGDGQDRLAPARREQAKAQIADLEARLGGTAATPERPAPATAGARASSDDAQEARAAARVAVSSAAAARAAAEAASAAWAAARKSASESSPAGLSPTPGPEPPAGAALDGRHGGASTAGYVLAGVSLAAGGAALGYYLFNRGRYHDWQREKALLDNHPEAVGHDRRVTDNNALADSLTRANSIIEGLSVAAGVLAAGSVSFFIADRVRARNGEQSRPSSRIALGLGGVSWSRTW